MALMDSGRGAPLALDAVIAAIRVTTLRAIQRPAAAGGGWQR